MSNPPQLNLAKAARALTGASNDSMNLGDARQVATRMVEHELFLNALLAPINGTLDRSICRLQEELEVSDLDDQALERSWRRVVESEARRFQNSEAIDDEAASEFAERASMCFGLDASRIPRLLRVFGSLSQGERLGVMFALRRSSLFEYLEALFERDGASVSISDPSTSFRKLIAQCVAVD